MPALEPYCTTHTADAPTPRRVVTSLYELMECLHKEAAPGEDDWVVAAMKHIVNTRQLTFNGLRHDHRVMCA